MPLPTIVLDGAKFVIGAFVGAVIAKRVEGRADLVSYFGHASAFTINNPGQPPFVIHTHDVVIQNVGKKPANNIRVSHLVLPPQYNVYPSMPYTVQTLPDGKQDIVVPLLVPGQMMVISYLYYPPLLWNQVHASIRSDEGFARQQEMLLQRKQPKWLINLALAGLGIGCLTVLYLIWRGPSVLGRAVSHSRSVSCPINAPMAPPSRAPGGPPASAPSVAPTIPTATALLRLAAAFFVVDMGAFVRPCLARTARAVIVPFSRLQAMCAGFRLPIVSLPPLERAFTWSASHAPSRPFFP